VSPSRRPLRGSWLLVPRSRCRARVASAFEAVADRRQRRRFPGPGHTHHEIKTCPLTRADCHSCWVALNDAPRRSRAGRQRRARLCSSIFGPSSPVSDSAALRCAPRRQDAACRPHLFSASGHDRQQRPHRHVRDVLDSLVEHRKGQSVKVRAAAISRRHGEGLLTRQAPSGPSKLAGEDLEVNLGSGRRNPPPRSRRRESAGDDQRRSAPPAIWQQVLDADFRLGGPGWPGRDRPRRVGSIGPTAAVICCRAGRVQFADLGRDAGYRPSSEPSGRPGSATIPYPISTALAACGIRPTAVAACRWSLKNAVPAPFQPPRASRITTAFAIRT